METVRVTVSTLEFHGEGYVEGDRLAVPGPIAEQLVSQGAAERVTPTKPAKRRERAIRTGRETR